MPRVAAARIARDQKRDALTIGRKLRNGAIEDSFFPARARDLQRDDESQQHDSGQ